MIAAMLDVNELQQSILFIVIERDNLERMKKADPITLESVSHGGLLPVPKYPQDFSILIAYEEDDDELYRRARAGNTGELIRWLERGRQFIPGLDGKKEAFKIPHDDQTSNS